MDSNDFTDKSKSESYATQLPTSGFIHTEEWLEHSLPKLLWYSASRIFYRQINMLVSLICGYCNLSERMIIFDGILNQIVYKPVNKDITAYHSGILTFSNQLYILFHGKRLKVCQNLFNNSIQYNFIIPSYRLKLTHVKKCLYHPV